MSKFHEGDLIVRVRDPEPHEWTGIGEVTLDCIPIGTNFVAGSDISYRHGGIKLRTLEGDKICSYDYSYPSCIFEPLEQQPNFKFFL